MIVTQGLNPLSTPDQLADQLRTLLAGGNQAGPSSPMATLGPWAEILDASRGIDPFSGQSTDPNIPGTGYQGPLAGHGIWAGLGAVVGGLPETRLGQQVGVIPGYRPPSSYETTSNTAVANFLGLPVRNARRVNVERYGRLGY